MDAGDMIPGFVQGNVSPLQAEIERLRRCIDAAMGCISGVAESPDERLAWFRLLDAVEGREPRPDLKGVKIHDDR